MENSKESESKYDISKSNFFANIPEKDENEPKNEIKEKTLELNSTPISSKNQQLPQNNFSNFNNNNINPNINNINNINNLNYANNTYNNPSYMNNNFYSSQNYNPQYQINNQYQNNMYYYPQGQNQIPPQTQTPSFFQKVSESAMNLIKKEDPLNIITDISPKFYEELIEKYKKEIQCQNLEKSKISDIEIKSIISNPRKINDSLLKNSYVIYDITTPKLNWFVNRRYSDFIWLREILMSLFPTILIPQLPKKKIGNRRFEDDFVQKRIKGLQNFLDEILKNEILKTSEPLITFNNFFIFRRKRLF